MHVSKADYYIPKGQETYFAYSKGYRSDPDNPVIFRLRKRGPGADLITSQYGVFPELKVSVPKEGTPIRIDLFNRKTGNNGQLEVSNIKPHYIYDVDQRGTLVGPDGGKMEVPEWSFRMSIPDGGFFEHDDEFPFEAPESGYQTALDFHFKSGSTNWTDSIRKQYYIMFGQPRKYGRIKFETGMMTGVNLSYAINPDGTRYLESK